MSMTTIGVEESKASVWLDYARDLWELTKPRISAMVLVTVALSMFVASEGRPELALILHTLLGTTLIAASSSAWNQWIERNSDKLMTRTTNRPLPAGRMSGADVLLFGTVTLLSGIAYMLATVGWVPTLWAILTWIIYVCVYTPLKARTNWNTTVGAVSGAMPILIGWSAVGTPVSWELAGMLLVVFFWQFPHFIAIAWIYRRQYEKAGLQMVTVTDPSGARAGLWAFVGALLLIVASLLPLFAQLSLTYTCITVILGCYLTVFAWQFRRELSERTARRLLAASIVYLPLALGMIAAQTVI